jgi:hypothetical protein
VRVLRKTKAGAFIALSGSALLAACVASADTDRRMSATIEWNAPPGCPDAAQVRAAIGSMVGAPSADREASLVARATITRVASGRFILQMQIDAGGVSEAKTIDAEACPTLADAFTVIVAFAIDPEVSADLPPAASRERATPSPSGDTPRVEPRTELDPVIARRSRPGVRWVAAGPLLALGAGLLPLPAYGVGGVVGLQAGVRWELAGVYWPERTTSVPLDVARTVGARLWLATAQPSACFSFGLGSTELCIGGAVGAMRAAGTGVPVSENGTSWWLALTGGVVARLRVARTVDLRFRLDVGVPLFRPSFVLENVGPAAPVEAYRPAPVFAVLGFQPEAHFFATDWPEARHAHQ